MKLIASIQGHYEILKILQIALFRKGSSVLIPGFDSCELDLVTIEMRHSNNFTHELLWVVTQTAWKKPSSLNERIMILEKFEYLTGRKRFYIIYFVVMITLNFKGHRSSSGQSM